MNQKPKDPNRPAAIAEGSGKDTESNSDTFLAESFVVLAPAAKNSQTTKDTRQAEVDEGVAQFRFLVNTINSKSASLGIGYWAGEIMKSTRTAHTSELVISYPKWVTVVREIGGLHVSRIREIPGSATSKTEKDNLASNWRSACTGESFLRDFCELYRHPAFLCCIAALEQGNQDKLEEIKQCVSRVYLVVTAGNKLEGLAGSPFEDLIKLGEVKSDELKGGKIPPCIAAELPSLSSQEAARAYELSQALAKFNRYDLYNLLIGALYYDNEVGKKQVVTIARVQEIRDAFETIADIYQVFVRFALRRESEERAILSDFHIWPVSKVIDSARNRLIEKLSRTEEQIKDDLEQKERYLEKIARQQEEIKARQAQQEEEQKRQLAEKIEAFHRAPQPVPLPPETKDELERLEKAAVKQAQRSIREYLSGAVSILNEDIIDWRGEQKDVMGDPKIKQLSDTLFSHKNILLISSALNSDLIKHFKDQAVPPQSPIPESAEAVSEIYRTSNAAKEQIDSMFDDRQTLLPLAAALLPLGRVRSYYSDISKKGDQQPGSLRAEVRNALEGRVAIQIAKTKIANWESKGGGDVNKSKQDATPAPEWIAEVVRSDQFAWEVRPDKSILVASRQNPGSICFVIEPRFAKDKDSFQSEFNKQLAEAYLVSQVDELRKELVKRHRCQIGTISDSDEIKVIHQATEIVAEVKGLPGQRLKQMQGLLERLDEHLIGCKALLDYAQVKGCQVESDTDQIVFKCGELQPLIIAKVNGTIALSQLERAYQFIASIPQQVERLQQHKRKIANMELAKDNYLGSHIIPKREDSVVIIPDTAVFLRLAAEASEGHTWLDLLAERADREGVHVWVPARVVYEVLGRASNLTDEGEVIEHQLREFSSDITGPAKSFLANATHIKLGSKADKDGNQILASKLGTDPRVAIVYTDGDKEFFDKASELISQAGGDIRALDRNAAQAFVGGQLGDQAISELIKHFPVKAKLVPITTDTVYVSSGMPNVSDGGAGVYPCHLGQYLMHEVTFNNSEAAAALGQSALTPHDMMEYLTAWWHARQGDSYDALFTPLLRGDLEARGYSSQECLAELFESDSLFGSAQLGDKADT